MNRLFVLGAVVFAVVLAATNPFGWRLSDRATSYPLPAPVPAEVAASLPLAVRVYAALNGHVARQRGFSAVAYEEFDVYYREACVRVVYQTLDTRVRFAGLACNENATHVLLYNDTEAYFSGIGPSDTNAPTVVLPVPAVAPGVESARHVSLFGVYMFDAVHRIHVEQERGSAKHDVRYLAERIVASNTQLGVAYRANFSDGITYALLSDPYWPKFKVLEEPHSDPLPSSATQ